MYLNFLRNFSLYAILKSFFVEHRNSYVFQANLPDMVKEKYDIFDDKTASVLEPHELVNLLLESAHMAQTEEQLGYCCSAFKVLQEIS